MAKTEQRPRTQPEINEYRRRLLMEATIEMLAEKGVAVEEGPVRRPAADGTWGASVYFRDPDGNLLELLTTDGAGEAGW